MQPKGGGHQKNATMGRWLSPVKTGRALWERLYDRTTADHGNLVLNERRLTPSHDLRQWNLSSCSLGEKAGCWFRQEWDRPEAQPQLSLSVMLTNSTRSTKLGRARRNGLAESWAKGGRARARPTGPLFDLQLIGDAACKMQSALRGRLGGNCPAPGIWVEDREENVIYDSQQSPFGPTAVGCCRSRVRNIALEREGGIHLDSGQVDDAPALATHARTHGMRWPCLVAENARPTFGGRQVGLQCESGQRREWSQLRRRALAAAPLAAATPLIHRRAGVRISVFASVTASQGIWSLSPRRCSKAFWQRCRWKAPRLVVLAPTKHMCTVRMYGKHTSVHTCVPRLCRG